jgi:DinB superfamily
VGIRHDRKMPEEHFTFRPVPEIRSFEEAGAHVADAQARNCNLVSGAGSKTLDADKKKTNAELLAALKESVAICDAAFAALTDAQANECSPPREDTGWSRGYASIRWLDEHGPTHRHLLTGGAERMNAGLVCAQQAQGRLRGEAR